MTATLLREQDAVLLFGEFKGAFMATAAVAVVLQARREIQHHFFAADAVRPERAVAFTPSRSDEARQFEDMLKRGTIKREGADLYWLDVVAYDLDMRKQHRRARIALLALSIVLAVVLIAMAIGSGHNH